jgi:hypothetical protein
MDQEETPAIVCECEHHSHFDAEIETHDPSQRSPVHTYGAPARELQAVKTPFGTFHMCQTCADTCYREYV